MTTPETSDWSFVLTPQFLIGTVIAGLLLNVVGAYLVRALDRARKALPASFRRAREEESERIKQLTTAATSDNALYAALAAEGSRLRLLQLLRFFFAFVSLCGALFFMTVGGVKLGSRGGGVAALVLVLVMLNAIVMYIAGLDIGRRADRLDTVLRKVQRNRNLPIMD